MSDDLGTKNLRLEREGPLAWCVIDRPAARNALTPTMYFGIKRAVHLVNTDPDLGALIITGTADTFAPGGDLGGRVEPGDTPVPEGLGAEILPFLAIRDSPAPVIAAVNGICQAGGLLIAMMADVCVASDRATFRVPELLRGIPDATYAAALAQPVDRRDDWCAAVSHCEEREDVGADRVGPGLADLRATAEVAARREHVTGAGDDQSGEVRVTVDDAHRALDAVVHGGRQRVARRRAIDHAPRDRSLTLEAQSRRAEFVLHRRTIESFT